MCQTQAGGYSSQVPNCGQPCSVRACQCHGKVLSGQKQQLEALPNLNKFVYRYMKGFGIGQENLMNLPLVNNTAGSLDDKTLAEHLERISGSSHYTSTFIHYKKSAERKSMRSDEQSNGSKTRKIAKKNSGPIQHGLSRPMTGI